MNQIEEMQRMKEESAIALNDSLFMASGVSIRMGAQTIPKPNKENKDNVPVTQ